MNMTKSLTMCYTSVSVHYYHSVHESLGSWRKCSFDITCSLHQCYCNCKLLSIATQHPELERLSMGARPKLGQMRTKHMSPWQPSKNKIERVRESGGTRISSTKLSIHTDILYICVLFVVRPNGQMEPMDRWNGYRLYFSCYCAFPQNFCLSMPSCVAYMALTLASHSITICSSSTEVPVHEIGKKGEGFAPHWDTFIHPALSLSNSDSHGIVQ